MCRHRQNLAKSIVSGGGPPQLIMGVAQGATKANGLWSSMETMVKTARQAHLGNTATRKQKQIWAAPYTRLIVTDVEGHAALVHLVASQQLVPPLPPSIITFYQDNVQSDVYIFAHVNDATFREKSMDLFASEEWAEMLQCCKLCWGSRKGSAIVSVEDIRGDDRPILTVPLVIGARYIGMGARVWDMSPFGYTLRAGAPVMSLLTKLKGGVYMCNVAEKESNRMEVGCQNACYLVYHQDVLFPRKQMSHEDRMAQDPSEPLLDYWVSTCSVLVCVYCSFLHIFPFFCKCGTLASK